MKTKKTLAAKAGEVESLVRSLADQDAGQKALPGLRYSKKLTGMNGHEKTVTTEIETLEPGRYADLFTNGGNTIRMSYTWNAISETRTELVYEEQSAWNTMKDSLNQKIVSVLFGLSARRQVRARLVAFEQLLYNRMEEKARLETCQG